MKDTCSGNAPQLFKKKKLMGGGGKVQHSLTFLRQLITITNKGESSRRSLEPRCLNPLKVK